MGWFGSFNDVGIISLCRGRCWPAPETFNGPVASGVAGAIYRSLSEERYFASDTTPKKDNDLPEILTTYSCCR